MFCYSDTAPISQLFDPAGHYAHTSFLASGGILLLATLFIVFIKAVPQREVYPGENEALAISK